MIQITQLKLPVAHTPEQLVKKAASMLHVQEKDILSWRILKRSIDARDRQELLYVYSMAVTLSSGKKETKILARAGKRESRISEFQEPEYHFVPSGQESLAEPPIIIGSGPAGLFCAWTLAKAGYRPVLLERGEEASKRKARVDHFWQTGILDKNSNVQFGEGGAGTFSDGKLNTGVKDKYGRNHEVLRIFVQAGAPEDILYEAKPHLGTDLLVGIVEELRRQIIAWGGTVHFRAEVTDLLLKGQEICGVRLADGREFNSQAVILAIGHSARDTFSMLSKKPLHMEAKSFAVGLRIQHPQEMINASQYGPDAPAFLGAASYKLTRTLADKRGVYSFCMCPGGYVVNASSEEGMLAVNGMSYHGRASHMANSAIIVSVGPEDFRPWHAEGTDPVLDGMAFQRALEAAAFRAGEGKIPVQRFEDFRLGRKGGEGRWTPCMKGEWQYADLRQILPDYLAASLDEGITGFDHRIPGFADPDALLAGIESRTSSPIRILRNPESLESSIAGLYPCGEGAGYAGGITSAAMDGLKVAEAVAARFRPFS